MPTADFNNGSATYSPYELANHNNHSGSAGHQQYIQPNESSSNRCYNTYSLYEQQLDLSYDTKLATIAALKESVSMANGCGAQPNGNVMTASMDGNNLQEQISTFQQRFDGWSPSEQRVALCSLVQKLGVPQSKVLLGVLERDVGNVREPWMKLEAQANDPEFIVRICSEKKENAVLLLQTYLPLLKPGSVEAKKAYMDMIPKIVGSAVERNVYTEDCRQLLSYLLIHPAVTTEERHSLSCLLQRLDRNNNNLGTGQLSPNAFTSAMNAVNSMNSTGGILNGKLSGCYMPAPVGSGAKKSPEVFQNVLNGSNFTTDSATSLFSTDSGTTNSSTSCWANTSASSNNMSGSTGKFVGGLFPYQSQFGNGLNGANGQPRSLTPPPFFESFMNGLKNADNNDFGVRRPFRSAIGSSSSTGAIGSDPLGHYNTASGMVNQNGIGGATLLEPADLARRLAMSHSGNDSSPDQLLHSFNSNHLPLFSKQSVPYCFTAQSTPTKVSSNYTDFAPMTRNRRSLSLTPPTPGCPSDVSPAVPSVSEWTTPLSLDDTLAYYRSQRSKSLTDHNGMSPPNGGMSSGSHSNSSSSGEQDAPHLPCRNTFLESNSGMKDVPAWLKSLRLHKYSTLFSQLTYDEMLALTEEQLETQNVTKGARHKIVISIQKLKDRVSLLHQIAKDISEGASIRTSVNELKGIIQTPIRAYRNDRYYELQAKKGEIPNSEDRTCENIPALFTWVFGKLCTQLLITSAVEDECFSGFLTIAEKCLNHEAFLSQQKREILAWKQQIHRIWKPRMTRNKPWTVKDRNFVPKVNYAAARPSVPECSMPNRVGPTEHQFNIYSSYMQQQQISVINGHSAVSGPMVSPSYMNGTHRLPLFSDFAQKSQQEYSCHNPVQRTISAPTREAIGIPAGAGLYSYDHLYNSAAGAAGLSCSNTAAYGQLNNGYNNSSFIPPSHSVSVGFQYSTTASAASPIYSPHLGYNRGWACGMEDTSVTINDLNNRLENLCCSMAEAAIGGIETPKSCHTPNGLY